MSMSYSPPSIFNDILGPIMVGPSSSHTCGPARIGNLGRQLVDGAVARAEIVLARSGSFTHSYKGQRSDMGFVGGLLGIREYDPGLADSFREARKAGMAFSFPIEDFIPPTPNHVILRLWNADGVFTEVHADSTGGGTVRLLRIDGLDVDIVGDAHELLLFCDGGAADAIAAAMRDEFPGSEDVSVSCADGRGLVDVKLRDAPSGEDLARFRGIAGVDRVCLVGPVHPVLSNRLARAPFLGVDEVLAAAADGTGLGELGIRYEMARAGWGRERVLGRADAVIDVMERAAEKAMSGGVRRHGILSPSSAGIRQNANRLDLGILDTAAPWAMGIMEVSSDMGVVIGGPTGGSAGVIPGAILGVAGRLGLSREETRLAMLAAGMTGVAVAAKGCNFSAELFGCQVEVGAASALAASGLVAALGGTARQSFDAAATAIHNILGLICDPVAGLVELPCISRNAMGVANAAVCVNMVMGGYDPLIGLDESVDVLLRVGRDMPAEHRCTGRGGLCVSRTGERLFAEQRARDDRR